MTERDTDDTGSRLAAEIQGGIFMGVLVNVGSIMGKEILNLAEGTMIGKVCGVALTSDNKVAGLKVRPKKIMGVVNVVNVHSVFSRSVRILEYIRFSIGDVFPQRKIRVLRRDAE